MTNATGTLLVTIACQESGHFCRHASLLQPSDEARPVWAYLDDGICSVNAEINGLCQHPGCAAWCMLQTSAVLAHDFIALFFFNRLHPPNVLRSFRGRCSRMQTSQVAPI